MAVHRNLTGADLHEPKGADTALSGQVYVSDGAGSGSWTDASSIITNSAFTTGDYKITGKVTADTGWIMYAYGTIGDGSSSATIRANADTSALFALYWNNYSNTLCPVSGGRGASAAADFAAHKTLTLPDLSQRVLGIAGNYNAGGLTSRTLGSAIGAETHALTVAQIPTLTATGTGTATAPNSKNFVTGSGSQTEDLAAGVNQRTIALNQTANATTAAVSVTTTTSDTGGATGSAHTIIQPTAYVNLMIRL